MTLATTRQSIRDWIDNLRQSKQPPAEKLAEVQQRKRDKAAELQKVLATSEQAILEKELSDLDAEEVVLVPEVAAAKLATYQKALRSWEAADQDLQAAVAASLLGTQGAINAWDAHGSTRPRPPAGIEDYFAGANAAPIFAVRKGIVLGGLSLGCFDEGGTGYAPLLLPKSAAPPQLWGVPAGMQRGK